MEILLYVDNSAHFLVTSYQLPASQQKCGWARSASVSRSPKARGTPNKDQPSRTDAQAGKGMYVMGSLVPVIDTET